jgi:hypothetical protein
VGVVAQRARPLTHKGILAGQSKVLRAWKASCTVVSSMKRESQICTLNLGAGNVRPVRAHNCPTRHRLAQAFSRLQSIQLARNHLQNPLFEKHNEDRIIWRELLDLELQDIDERMEDYQRLQESLSVAELS